MIYGTLNRNLLVFQCDVTLEKPYLNRNIGDAARDEAPRTCQYPADPGLGISLMKQQRDYFWTSSLPLHVTIAILLNLPLQCTAMAPLAFSVILKNFSSIKLLGVLPSRKYRSLCSKPLSTNRFASYDFLFSLITFVILLLLKYEK